MAELSQSRLGERSSERCIASVFDNRPLALFAEYIAQELLDLGVRRLSGRPIDDGGNCASESVAMVGNGLVRWKQKRATCRTDWDCTNGWVFI